MSLARWCSTVSSGLGRPFGYCRPPFSIRTLSRALTDPFSTWCRLSPNPGRRTPTLSNGTERAPHVVPLNSGLPMRCMRIDQGASHTALHRLVATHRSSASKATTSQFVLTDPRVSSSLTPGSAAWCEVQTARFRLVRRPPATPRRPHWSAAPGHPVSYRWRPSLTGIRALTEGSVNHSLLNLAVPTLFANVLLSVNGSVNSIWVGHYMGEAALTATSNANLLMQMVMGAAFGTVMVATVIVGQRVGAKEMASARDVVRTSAALFVSASAVIAAIGLT